MCILWFPNQRQNFDYVYYHREWVSLGEPLLSVKEFPHPSPIPDHQGGPLAATFEFKICATVPIVLDLPHNYGPVLLIECIVRVNEDKPPVLILRVLLPHNRGRLEVF